MEANPLLCASAASEPHASESSHSLLPDQELIHRHFAIGKETLPLRLIDVSATLAARRSGGITFIAATNWKFHVISHTWSQSIRKFSEAVGKSIGLQSTADPQKYSDAFQEASFADDRGYQDLISFLDLLVEDGVDKVWFDALCINQHENAKDEKEREIMHMGAYYKHSAGCYVVNHGLGRGYNLLGRDEKSGEECLPRWFTRVWTLQEFVLPSKLTFLVDDLSSEVTSLISKLSTVESCRLCTRITSNTEEINHPNEGLMKMFLCSRCNELPLIRNISEEQQVYFVDRAAYFGIVWRFGHGPPLMPSANSCVPHKTWQIFFRELYMLLPWCCVCNSYELFHLIQRRFCSEEEDRVLSILSLLGLDEKNMQPVRTHQTLEEQLVKVAGALAMVHPKLLLHMCIENVISSTHKELSWVPNLRRNMSQGEEDTSALDHQMSAFARNTWRLRHASVQLKEVTRGGALRLEGNVVDARIVVGSRGSMQQHFNEADCNTCLKLAQTFDCAEGLLVHQTMAGCHLEVPQNLSIPLQANALTTVRTVVDIPDVVLRQKGCMLRLDPRSWPRSGAELSCSDSREICTGGIHLPIPCLHFLLPVDVSLLLWGENSDGSSIVMVCMGTTKQQLHKIGVLLLASEVANAIFSSNKPASKYLLGGFERQDVREFWRKWGVVHNVPCNCHATITIKAYRSFLGTMATRRKVLGYHRAKPTSPDNIGPIQGLSLMSDPPTDLISMHLQHWGTPNNLKALRQSCSVRRCLRMRPKIESPIPLNAVAGHRANPDHIVLGFPSMKTADIDM